MKTNNKLQSMMMAVALMSLTITSCHEYDNDDPEPQPVTPVTPGTIDTAEWPFDACIDSTDAPGNDFYKYISIGYAKNYNGGFLDETSQKAKDFINEECSNPTSSALKALNKWGEMNSEEIHKRELDAITKYSNSIANLDNKQLLTLVLRNSILSSGSIASNLILANARKLCILPYPDWNLNINISNEQAIAEYVGQDLATFNNYAARVKPLYDAIKPTLSTTSSLCAELKKMESQPGYVPEGFDKWISNSITSRADNTLSEAEQILLDAFYLNTEDAGLLCNLENSISNLTQAINAILQYKNQDEMHDALEVFLNLGHIYISYTTTHTDEKAPHITAKNFYEARFCQMLFSNEYINLKVKSSYIQPVSDMATQIRNTFDSRLDSLGWMSPSTKAYAKKKLAAMIFWYGLPKSAPRTFDVDIDTEKDLATCPSDCYMTLAERYYKTILLPQLKRDTFDEDAMYIQNSSAISSLPYQANAFYSPYSNIMNILASNLVKHNDYSNCSEAFFYGTTGHIIGHEICHGFDATGSKHNTVGKIENWWTVSDLLKYKEKQDALVNLYNQYQFTDSKGGTCVINGTKTLTENMADHGGITIAYDAFCRLRKSQGYDEEGMREQKRRFFLSNAMLWSEQESYLNQYYQSPTDNHSPHCIRANGANQIDDWYDIFNVQWGDKYYLEPSQRIKLW